MELLEMIDIVQREEVERVERETILGDLIPRFLNSQCLTSPVRPSRLYTTSLRPLPLPERVHIRRPTAFTRLRRPTKFTRLRSSAHTRAV